MKNLLFVHHSGGLGGAPRSLSLLLDNVDSTKYSTSLLCIYRGPVLEIFKPKPIKIIINERIYPFHGSTVVEKSLIVFLVNLIGPLFSFFNSRKVIRQVKPDIVHLNSSCLFVTALAVKSIDKNIKVICHVREPLRETIAGKIIKNMCYWFVDRFIAIDHFTGASMKTKNNIDIVYNPVDFTLYNPELKSKILKDELNLDADSVVFLYLARVAKGNGALELVNRANILSKKHPNYHFVIAGLDEENMDRYSKNVVKEAEGNSNIHLMKFRKDVPELIASSDIVIIPFTEPHFARAAIEAASVGKPCIGAKIGGVDELIIHNVTGYLYSTLEEFDEYCIDLGENRLKRQDFGERAVLFARENFDDRESSRRVFAAYE